MTTFHRYTRKFESFEDYEIYYGKHNHHEGITDIVENKYTVCADAEFACKTWKTAIKRFGKAIACDIRFDGWYEYMFECCENGNDTETMNGEYAWSVEPTIEGFWHIFLRVQNEHNTQSRAANPGRKDD